MRFPVFSSDHFLPQHHFYRCGPSTARQSCCSGSPIPPRSSLPSWPAGATAAATFIPVMMMGRPTHRGEPRQHHHTAPSSSQRPQGFCAGGSALSQPNFTEAFNVAQRLLGEMFGQSACPSADAAKRRGNTTSRQSPSPPQKKCSDKTSTAPRCRQAQASSHEASNTAPKSSHCEKTTGSASVPATSQKTGEDQRAVGQSESSSPCETRDSQIWCHILCLSGFAPSKVSVKVKNGMAYVHAVKEETYSPSACLNKLETTQVVTLPENIDRKTLTCSMKQNGTLLFQAHFNDNLTDKNNAIGVEMLADKADIADAFSNKMLKPDSIEDKSQKELVTTDIENTQASASQGEKGVDLELEEKRMGNAPDKLSESSAENLNISENNATHMDALSDVSQMDSVPQTNTGDLQTSETMTEQTQINADSAESLQEKLGLVETSDGSGFDTSAEKTAACCTSEEPTLEKSDTSDCCLGDEEEKTDPEEVKKQSSTPQIEENTENQTTPDKNGDLSFPIIEEPEDDSFSADENLLQCHAITQQSSTEDFVVIGDDTIGIEDMTAENGNNGIDNNNIQTAGEATSADQVETEEDIEGKPTDRQIDPLNGTDPTRPIKRTNGVETTQDSEANISTPSEQSGKVGSISSTQAAVQKHAGAFSASLPLEGFKPEDVHVSLQGHALHIVAKRQAWLGEAPYMETVMRDLELPNDLDVFTVKCVYQQDDGCLVITAEPESQQRQVPVVLQ